MADGQGYAVDLDSFQRTLTDHVDPAVDHLREGADSLRPIGGLATARFVGKDPEQIYGGFTGQADALQKRIATANDALWDSLRQLRQADPDRTQHSTLDTRRRSPSDYW